MRGPATRATARTHPLGRHSPVAAECSALVFGESRARAARGQVIARDRDDLDARWDRAVLYQEVGEHRRALAAFDVIAEARPADGEARARAGSPRPARRRPRPRLASLPDAAAPCAAAMPPCPAPSFTGTRARF
jgi:hypothetical protein